MALDPNLLIIGFDAEWVRIPDTDTNHILSYQYFGKTSEGTWSGIIYTEGSSKRDRLKLAQFVGRAIEAGRKEGVLGHKWPKKVYLAAHFSRADLSSFSDFQSLKDRFDSVRKTYATVTTPHNVRYNDDSNNKHPLTIWLIDTMLISPGGSSLANLGGLYDLPKIELPDGAIDHMDVLLKNDPSLFERYAIRDAEISAEHAWRMAEFVSEQLDGSSPPITLGSLAVEHLLTIWKEEGVHIDEVLGNEAIKERKWNAKLGRSHTKTEKVPIESVSDHMSAVAESYHGGRSEAYVFGFAETDRLWEDVDLTGAYTTAMAAIRMPDWRNLQVVYEVDALKEDKLGSARVKFSFPEDTRFPCLPVRSADGLIFPLEGKTYVGSPEIVLAREMGAELEIVEGIIVPWTSDLRPFEVFSASIHTKRQEHQKGSIEERTWKEIGNSLYGKLAQGIQKKRVFDSREDQSAILPPSKITQPYLASYITSLVRAVLGELLHRIPPDNEVVSATTDGFISNTSIDELDLTGPLCRLFSELRERIADGPEMLEVKHIADTVLCWKMRGQASATPDIDFPSISAKAGIKPPKGLKEQALEDFDPYSRIESAWFVDEQIAEEGDAFWVPPELRSFAESEWVVELFLNRKPDQMVESSHLISMREMFDTNSDMINVDREQRLNMEYDWKRELVDPIEREHPVADFTGSKTHLFARSRPWKSVDDFKRVRELFDNWRTKSKGVLKTKADWDAWQEYQLVAAASVKGISGSKKGYIDQARRAFLQAYATGKWELPGGDYKGIAIFLTEHGYPTTEYDLKNAKRKKARLAENAFERTDEIMTFKDIILTRYPDFDWEKMVVEAPVN